MSTLIAVTLIISFAGMNYFSISIKGILRLEGYKVRYVGEWGYDLERFKLLTHSRSFGTTKKKYKRILYGYYASIGYLILTALIGFVITQSS